MYLRFVDVGVIQTQICFIVLVIQLVPKTEWKLHMSIYKFQIYAEMIGNVMVDARSTGKYYHCK